MCRLGPVKQYKLTLQATYNQEQKDLLTTNRLLIPHTHIQPTDHWWPCAISPDHTIPACLQATYNPERIMFTVGSVGRHYHLVY